MEMKKLLLFTALLLVVGCATRKSSTSIEQHAVEQTKMNLHREQSSNRQSVTNNQAAADLTEAIREATQSQSAEKLKVDVIMYDTNKPTDSTTGKPPLLAEMTVQRDRQHMVQQERKTDIQASEQSASGQITSQTDSSRTELTASADRQADMKTTGETKKTQWIPWWVWLIGGGLLGLGVICKVIKWK